MDGILITVAGIVVLLVTGTSGLGPVAVGVFLPMAYFAAFELQDGRSPGKRHFGVKVVMVRDGSPPDPRAVFWRALLRPVDALPLFYTSGLISLLRTGPERRQRLGDVLAGTVVVGTGEHELSRRSPRWLLPLLIAGSLLTSAVGVMGTIDAARQGTAVRAAAPEVGPPPATAGFRTGAAPAAGYWRARLTIVRSAGFSPSARDREWSIGQICPRAGQPQACSYQLTRFVPGDSADVAPLMRTASGWRADYRSSDTCGRLDGRWIDWPLNMHVKLRFSADHRHLIGTETMDAYERHCGNAITVRTWVGHWIPAP